MSLGFTGTSDEKAITCLQIRSVEGFLGIARPTHVHHGDCIGWDSKFHDICFQLENCSVSHITIHPPLILAKRAFKQMDKHYVKMAIEVVGPKPYLDRNKDIVDETDMLLACPHGAEYLRSGTWSTVRYARKKGKPVVIIYPGGDIDFECELESLSELREVIDEIKKDKTKKTKIKS